MNIPQYVPEQHAQKWQEVNSIYGAGSRGALAANSWLKNEINKPVQVRQVLHFEVQKENGSFIKRSEADEDYISFVLADNQKHKDGIKYTDDFLADMANQINARSIIGDVDHMLYDSLLKSNMSDEQVEFTLENKPGIAKSVRAIFENGKLWIRALIDKRYRKVIEKSKGVSLEAIVNKDDETDIVSGGKILGFTFNINTNPAQFGVGLAA